MDTFTPKERAVNFSKLEKVRFQSLIEKYKDVLFSKRTDNISNLRKNKTWAAIHAEFNAGGDQPRSLRQLKAKFDNMKRNARKDASHERQSRLRTGGGPPAPPVQPETEWFRGVMPISIDGLQSVVDDDFTENQNPISSSNNSQPQEVINLNEMSEESNVLANEHGENMNPSENIVYTGSDTKILIDNVFDAKSPASLLRTPVSKPLRVRKLCHGTPKRNPKSELITQIREQEDHIYRLKIKHMEEKRNEEREIYELQKKEILLKINLLVNKSDT